MSLVQLCHVMQLNEGRTPLVNWSSLKFELDQLAIAVQNDQINERINASSCQLFFWDFNAIICDYNRCVFREKFSLGFSGAIISDFPEFGADLLI